MDPGSLLCLLETYSYAIMDVTGEGIAVVFIRKPGMQLV